MSQVISTTIANGITLSAAADAAIITPTAAVFSGTAEYAIYLTDSSDFLITNEGFVYGENGGMRLHSPVELLNQVSGTIVGANGINIAGNLNAFNAGSIIGQASSGILAQKGGDATNQITGLIWGGEVGFYSAAAAVVTNYGIITGYVREGVELRAGGVVNNDVAGAISGGYAGVYASGAAGTVINSGLIAGNGTAGVMLTDGGQVTNQTIGTIAGGTYGLLVGGAAGTVSNAGLIAGTVGGMSFALVGVVTNQSIGRIAGGNNAIAILGSSGTVTNAGVITGQVTMAGSGTLTNFAGGTIRSTYQNGVYVLRAASVTNAGAILSSDQNGVRIAGGGSATNQASGVISGAASGIIIAGAAGTVTNLGIVTGTSQYGLGFQAGGTVSNQSGGTIGGATEGIYIKGGTSAAVTNAGVVTGAAKYGVKLHGAATIANLRTGTISGATDGIYLTGTGAVTVTNAGWIGGAQDGILIRGETGTLTNAGTISGATAAIVMANARVNRVIADPGAVFYGTVNGGYVLISPGTPNTLELAAGTAAGQIAGLGFQFTNFGQTTIDAEAQWTISGANAVVIGAMLSNSGTLTLLDGSLNDAGGLANAGLIQETAETVTAASLTGSGSVVIGSGSTLTVTGAVASGQTIGFAGTGLLALAPAAFAGQIDGLGGGDQIELIGITDATSAGIVNDNTLAIQQSAGPTIDLTLDPMRSYTGVVFPIVTQGGVQFVDAAAPLGPTVIDQGETESVTGAAGSTLAAIAGAGGGITVTGANSLLTTTAGPFVVGDTGPGSLSIEAGGTVDAQNGLIVAELSGASGSAVEIAGAGSELQITNGLTVGDAGSGSMSLSEGASVSAGALIVSAAVGGAGDVSLDGTGTTLDATGALTLGGAAAGELSILGGAQMTIAGGLVGSGDSAPGNLDVEGSGSQLTINNGTLVVGANGPAEFTLGIGAVLSGEVANGPFGVVNEYGNVDPPTDPNDGTQNVGFGNSLIYDFFVANSGTIKITSGTATFYTPLVTDETNAADGSTNGLWVIGAHDTLVMNASSVDNTQTFDFTSPSAASLVIGQVPQASTTEFDTFNGQTLPSLTGSIAPGAPNVLPGWNAPIENYQSGDLIVLQGLTYRSATASGDVVTMWSGTGGTGNPLGSLTFVTKSGAPSSTEAAAAASQINSLACFAAGTRIETVDGWVKVEDLAVGHEVWTIPLPSPGSSGGSRATPTVDQVPRTRWGMTKGDTGTATVSSAGAPCEAVVWIGSRTVNCMRHPKPETVWPVRIARGAFGANVPARELYLSPDHALFINGVLVPVKLLINRTSITQIKQSHVTYYHVELPHHAVILAEGLPVESYLDTGDRTNFDHPGIIRLFPDLAARPTLDAATTWETKGAAPLVLAGPRLDAARRLTEAMPRRHARPEASARG